MRRSIKLGAMVVVFILVVAIGCAGAWAAGLFEGSVAIDGSATMGQVSAIWTDAEVLTGGNETYGDVSVGFVADTLTITGTNLFPGFTATISGTLQSTSSIPATVSAVVSDGAAVTLSIDSGFTGSVAPGGSSSGVIGLLVEDAAEASEVADITGAVTLVQAVP